ncbi:MAG: hypothetical protein MUO26_09175 [Methanotrichaceae archaeon]|nr:hypothetical protein [Methanotrichaceae archaeon]
MKGYSYLKNSFLILFFISLILGSNAFAVCPDPNCQDCGNNCSTYAPYWVSACPSGERCIEFKNSCSQPISLYYQTGCDCTGKPGAPECNCTKVPNGTISVGHSLFWQIVDANDSSTCCPTVNPPCLTTGLAVIANYEKEGGTCTQGTRVEFTAGNHLDIYNRFDSYNIDVEKKFYSIPVAFTPDVTCSHTIPLDCRPLFCNRINCPDAYSTPDEGGCPDNRSPQGNCPDTFGNFGIKSGFTVEYCPANGQSCQKSKVCSSSSLGDNVWIDSDGDGLQDPGEKGLDEVLVNLFDPTGVLLDTRTTDSGGHYEFTIPTGQYQLEFVKPSGYKFTLQNRGTNRAKDSDADPETGKARIINLAPDQNDLTWDAGLIPAKKPKTSINKQTIQVGDQSTLALRGSTENIVNIITNKKIN